MLRDALRSGDISVDFRYSTDGKLFNPRRLQTKTKVLTDTARMRTIVHLMLVRIQNCKSAWICSQNPARTLALPSLPRKQVLHQPAPSAPSIVPNITVNGQRLAVADKFVYLGSTLSRSVNIDEEVSYRIVRASAAFSRTQGQRLGAKMTEPGRPTQSIEQSSDHHCSMPEKRGPSTAGTRKGSMPST